MKTTLIVASGHGLTFVLVGLAIIAFIAIIMFLRHTHPKRVQKIAEEKKREEERKEKLRQKVSEVKLCVVVREFGQITKRTSYESMLLHPLLGWKFSVLKANPDYSNWLLEAGDKPEDSQIPTSGFSVVCFICNVSVESYRKPSFDLRVLKVTSEETRVIGSVAGDYPDDVEPLGVFDWLAEEVAKCIAGHLDSEDND